MLRRCDIHLTLFLVQSKVAVRLGGRRKISSRRMRDAERGVMVKIMPPACLVMLEPDFRLEFLITALNVPTQFWRRAF
jgi:hypothetical protein